MATKEQLEKALRNAHAAGDTAAAQRFAGEIKKLSSGPSPAQKEFDDLPMWQKPIKALDDLLRVGSDAVTFGGIDRVRALMGTQPSVEAARAETAKADERSGLAGTATRVGSTLPLMMALPQVTVPQSAGPVVQSLGNTALAALEGAGWGGVDALGHGEDVLEGQTQGALFGGGASVATGLLGKGLDMVVNRSTRGERIEPRDLRLAKDRAYNAMEDEAIGFRPAAVDDLITRIDQTTRDAYPGVQEGVRAARGRARRNLTENRTHTGPGQGFGRVRTMTEIDKERQNFRRDAVNNPQTTNKEMGLDVIQTIDDWLEDATSNPASVTAGTGDPGRALGMLQEARGLNQRVEKLDMLDERLGKAKRASERNLYAAEDSTIKQNIEGILGTPKNRNQYNAAEQAQMELINSGTAGQNILRQGGRAAPGGALMWPGVGAGAAIGSLAGPVGAVVGGLAAPVAGILSKKLSARSTRKQAEKLVDMVSTGRDLRDVKVLSPAMKKDLVRFLTSLGLATSEGD